MGVDYDNFAKTFSNSRKKMKWEEIDYFISSYLTNIEGKSVLDIGCGSGRLLDQFSNSLNIDKINYLGIDISGEMIKNAKANFPEKEFLNIDMSDLNKLKGQKFDFIFFIASFHHLENIKNRLQILKKVKELLTDDGIILMTNWALDSELNHEKYSKNIIEKSKNIHGSLDYSIKIGDYTRYYHGFNVAELEFLFNESKFEIIENKEFETGKNIISVIKRIKKI